MISRPLHVLVSGPYGGLNLGDDAIAEVICAQLSKRNIVVTLAANNVENARRICPTVFVTERLNLRCGKLASLFAIRDCDAVLIGGGEQFSETRIPNPIWGHLATNVQLSYFSRLFGKKYALIGVGVDSDISGFGRFLIRGALRKADFVGVRDADSQQRLSNLINIDNEVYLGADPVFLMEPMPRTLARHDIEKRFGISPSSQIVLMVLSIDKFNSLSYIKCLNEAVKNLIADGIYIIYAVTDVQPSFDLELFRKGMLYQNKKTFWLPPGEDGVNGVRRVIAAVDCVVSSRMHPIIFAAVQHTPFVCLSRSAKMHALMNMLGISDYLSLNSFQGEDLIAAIERRLTLAHERCFEAPLAAAVSRLKERAEAQFDELILNLTADRL